MTHITPAVYGLWAIMSVLLFAFCVYHLWHYDRFRCLRWDNPRSGVFKRFMTYTYILSLPTLATFAIGNAAIKYKEGFIFIPGHGIVPKPYQLWAEKHLQSIFPLMMVLSFAWALEMITHLEELCFWLFLTSTRSAQRDWFRSKFFYIWMIGSVFAITYMPVVTALGRDNPLKCESWTFLAGSVGSLTLTALFIPVLYIFPSFLRNLEAQGVDQATVVRLRGFQELNRARVFFRLMFTGAFLVLGVDGVHEHHVNESMFWTDFLAMVGAFGCCLSSALTLVIFFPRSAVTEYMVTKSKQMATSIAGGQAIELREEPRQFVTSSPSSVCPTKAMVFATEDDDEPPAYISDPPSRTRDRCSRVHVPLDGSWRNLNVVPSVYSPPPSRGRDFNSRAQTTTEVPLRPNRREDAEFGREGPTPTSQVLLSASANNRPTRAKSNGGNSLKNWLRNVKSPIDMMQ